MLQLVNVGHKSLADYATIATRQHYFADLPPGVLLAAVSYWIAARRPAYSTREIRG